MERDYCSKTPHRVDRPVLVDATVDQTGGLRFVQCLPSRESPARRRRLHFRARRSPTSRPDDRIDSYVATRGWRRPVDSEWTVVRPLPFGGDFAAFWRLGGARVAKLGLRGGFSIR